MSPPARRGSTPDPAGAGPRLVRWRQASGRGKRPAARRPTGAPRHRRSGPARLADRLLGAFIASALVVGFLLVAVFPTRTLLTQRADTAEGPPSWPSWRRRTAS